MPVKNKSEKTAVLRKQPSGPCKALYEDTLYLPEGCTVLDFGCGYEDDVKFLKSKGYKVTGYDPYYNPNTDLHISKKYELVMSNYVLGCIENIQERNNLIMFMWDRVQSGGCLSIAVKSKDYVYKASRKFNWTNHKDGWLTAEGVFHKGYNEDQLTVLVMNLPNVAFIETSTPNKFISVRVLKR